MIWRKALSTLAALALTSVPATALAMGADKEEPNWKLWGLATLLCFIIIGPLVATGLYAWWMRPSCLRCRC
jgi:cytochrome c-type biogenesis protein CcmH/NrfG